MTETTRNALSKTAWAALLLASPQLASAAPRTETAVLAGGCFWGVESVFEHVRGVRDVVSGFAGGTRTGIGSKASRDGYAEAVRITYDPGEISYVDLLKIFFRIAHDPTQVNRQGPDVGPQYRSAIFPQNAQQRQQAQQMLAQLGQANAGRKPIATKIESGRFSVAEAAHQDYVRRNPRAPYVVVNDLPKLAELKRAYPQLWKS